MTNGRFVLDTNAALYLLKRDTVPEPFASADFAVSIITRIELLAKRDITAEDEEELRSFLTDVEVVPITETVETAVIALRRRAKIKLPDSIIAATAIALNLPLLTHDEQLLGLSWPSFTVLDFAPPP
ncbi:MAG: type II toxin-antitoxin system VapC family toxin [Treponema sp.]|jgi:predicted nucleic acid-binding protein|nr:type II toxin-antitoxin system VapC family toxin [Treponema sp.]